MTIQPDTPHPLGATWDGAGVNFALFSEHATHIELCLFDSVDAPVESQRIPLKPSRFVWHVRVEGLRPGQLYGYRVDGPYDPGRGLRFNPRKLLMDPYARAVARPARWDDALLGYQRADSSSDLADGRDSAPFVPLAAVIDPAFDWGGDRPPRTPWRDTIIYEAHVKGLTQLHPEIPPSQRGTYSAMTSAPVLDHLIRLGITAVELLPIHHHFDEEHLAARGLTNYWGYNTLAFFAPDTRYASSPAAGDAVREFKTMVRGLHAAGLEVILDVVYNHTAEGNRLGPTLSMRGIDNHAYYRLAPGDPRFYVNHSGCGNTLNVQHPRVLQLIMDSLRYWVTEMHVDGFRFDLASALARGPQGVDMSSAFFQAIQQDPVISQVKLIAEPWDVGPGGYQVGNFPAPWAEWNGRYRDSVRRFWRGDDGTVSELATRLAGSADLYARANRGPLASINFVTAHDGFTLHDLVSYSGKHNEANGEHNADGENNNFSSNNGTEGPTDDPAVTTLRDRQVRNFIATLCLSQGVPMLSGGDELGRTQHGNNNAYCQDNEISWTHWNVDGRQRSLFDFASRAIRLRKNFPVLRRRSFLRGQANGGNGHKDVTWLTPAGREMSTDDWNNTGLKCVGAIFAGGDIGDTDENGAPVLGEPLLYLLNAGLSDVDFTLPDPDSGHQWECVLDTADGSRHDSPIGAVPFRLASRSVAVFTPTRRTHPTPTGQATAR